MRVYVLQPESCLDKILPNLLFCEGGARAFALFDQVVKAAALGDLRNDVEHSSLLEGAEVFDHVRMIQLC